MRCLQGELGSAVERAPRRAFCVSEIAFAVTVSLAWLALYNAAFWHQALESMWQPSLHAAMFFVSLFGLVLFLQSVLLLLMPGGVLMRAAASVLFVVAAIGSYFSSSYGVLMNKDMLRNVFETDLAEATALLTPRLVLHVLLFGALPAFLVWRICLRRGRWWERIRGRVLFIALAGLLVAGGMLACSADYAVFLREHKPIRFALSPAAPVASAVALVKESRSAANLPLIDAGGGGRRVGGIERRPLLLFVVVGETARAANFHLGGYARDTNPQLGRVDDLVYFERVASCGTSTAVSVPCMFSHLDRGEFKVGAAGRYTNVLDTLVAAGFDVEWRENNAGCKGVCERVNEIRYAGQDPALCPNSHCYDEVMLADLDERLGRVERDTAIVFHQIGSHGPAYFERYPTRFERFTPACRSHELQNCSPQELVNSYDNSIVYTDHVLATLIAKLKEKSGRVDSVLIYASDHGESLGERGIYLHGMPYSFAPQVQTSVPMLIWASDAYVRRTELSRSCLRSRAGRPLSHDNLYHTILGAAQVRNEIYDARRDVLAGCRLGPQEAEQFSFASAESPRSPDWSGAAVGAAPRH